MKPSDTGQARPGQRRRGMAKIVWVAGSVVVVGTVGALALASGRGGESAKTSMSKADRATVKRMSFEITTTSSGALEAKNETILRSKLETRSQIVELVAEGTFVKAGQVLVKLNSDEIEKQIDTMTLETESARSELVAAQNGVEIQKIENDSELRKANLKVELAQLALKQWEEGEHKQKLMDLAVGIEKNERDLKRLVEKYERAEKLEKDGFLSKDEKEQDWLAKLDAEARNDKAKLDKITYDSYEEPKNRKTKVSDLQEATAELDRVAKNATMDLSIKEAAASNRQQQLSKRENKLSELKEQLENSTIKAPADGMVVYATSMERFRRWDSNGKLQIGQDINPNQELIILPDTSVMVASVKVHESLAGRVKEGMPATVKVEAASATFAGKVDSKSIMADDGGWWDQTRQYSVKIAIDSEQASGLKPADNCEATIVLGDVEDAITVPIQAVFNDGPVRFVYLQTGGHFTRTPIRLGRTSDTLAEVEKGLTEGQTVLLREPMGGEYSPEPWVRAALELAEYKVGEDGQPLNEAPKRGGKPGGEGATAQAGPGGGGRGGKGGRGGQGGGKTVIMKTGDQSGAVVKVDDKAGDKTGDKAGDKADHKPGDAVAEKPAEGADAIAKKDDAKPADGKATETKTADTKTADPKPAVQPASGTSTTPGIH